MQRKWSILVAAIAAVVAVVLGLTLSSKAQAQQRPKVSNAHAIRAALDKVPGRARVSGTEVEDGTRLFEVLVVGEDGKTYEVEVNGNTGEVVEVEQADPADEEDDD